MDQNGILSDDDLKKLHRFEQAKRIMEEPMVVEAFAAIEQGIFDAFLSTPIDSVAGREHLHKLNVAMQKFKGVFEAHLQTGQILASQIAAEERKKSMLDRAKEFVYGNA